MPVVPQGFEYIHYNKGSLVMYGLKEAVGEDVVNRSLRRLLERYAFSGAPYPSSLDFLRLLREEAGSEHEELIADLFERITLYDLRAHSATAAVRPDGEYDVTFTLGARKFYSDGAGVETEAALSEPFAIGFFTEEPGKAGYSRASVLSVTREVLESGEQSLTLRLPSLPRYAGVDPYNVRIDRNSEDNLTPVILE